MTFFIEIAKTKREENLFDFMSLILEVGSGIIGGQGYQFLLIKYANSYRMGHNI